MSLQNLENHIRLTIEPDNDKNDYRYDYTKSLRRYPHGNRRLCGIAAYPSYCSLMYAA